MNNDLISRSALKKSLNFVYDCDYIGSKSKEGIASDIIEEIDNAPTVEVTDYDTGYQDGLEDGLNDIRPQGEWIIVKDEKYGDNVKCPFCGKELAGTDLNFCVKCGAAMRGEKNEYS